MARTGRPPTPPIIRFLQKIQQEGDCWIWTGSKHRGYGQFHPYGTPVRAHRWSYEYHRAEIPEGLAIDHLCRNRACVNPWHLEPVTTQENNLRAEPWNFRQRKTHCKHGHEFTEENTIQRADGRECRACQRSASKRYKTRIKAKKETTA